MRKRIITLALVTIAIVTIAVAASADCSLLGISGGIFTPSDKVLAPEQFTASFNLVQFDRQTNFLAASFGVLPGLEVGIVRDQAGSSSEIGLNVKYSLLKETATAPSIAIGATDATSALSANSNPGIFVVVGKNLTHSTTNITDQSGKPLHGYVGYGSGLYDGPFAGLNWSVLPKADLVVEYLTHLQLKDSIDKSSVLNLGVKLRFEDNFGAALSLIDLKDLGYGIYYKYAM